MKKMRLVIALLLAAPFAAFSANLEPGSVTGPAGVVVEDAGGSYECCWIFRWGTWWCVPC